MCTSAQLGPALLYLSVAYVTPFLLLSLLLAVLPSVRVSRRLGLSRAVAAWCLIPVVGPAIFLWSVAYLRLPESSVGANERWKQRPVKRSRPSILAHVVDR